MYKAAAGAAGLARLVALALGAGTQAAYNMYYIYIYI